MKKYIKKLVPKKYWNQGAAIRLYLYDINRFIRYSNTYSKLDNNNKIIGNLSIYYHIIEKGLTMPEIRLGFGKEVVEKLIELLNLFINEGYDKDQVEFKHSIGVLHEYYKLHEDCDFELENKENLRKFLKNKREYLTTQQHFCSNEDFLKNTGNSFDKFCISRKTIRNYTAEDIPNNIFIKCTELAQTSPSSCNRQANRLYIVKNEQLKGEVLKLQNGNRGFGHLAHAIIVFSSDLSVLDGLNERNDAHLNSGMFTMSFAYALHFYEIGSCFLNWSSTEENDLKLRKLLNIPDNEIITTLMSCGKIPIKIKIAKSPKKISDQITKIFN